MVGRQVPVPISVFRSSRFSRRNGIGVKWPCIPDELPFRRKNWFKQRLDIAGIYESQVLGIAFEPANYGLDTPPSLGFRP